MSFPLPEPTPLSQPYWDALSDGRLTFQHCGKCGHNWLPPRAECPECLGPEWDWQAASGKGRVISWVIYHHAYHDAFKDRLPYNVALVELGRHLGGMTSGGLGWADMGRPEIVGGLAREFFHRIYVHYQPDAAWKYGTRKPVWVG